MQPVKGGVTSHKVHAIHKEYVINVSLSSGVRRDKAWGVEVGGIFPEVGKSESLRKGRNLNGTQPVLDGLTPNKPSAHYSFETCY